MSIAPLIAILTPADEIASEVLTGKHGMKPFIALAVGAGLVYLALTGKASRVLNGVFGK